MITIVMGMSTPVGKNFEPRNGKDHLYVKIGPLENFQYKVHSDSLVTYSYIVRVYYACV